MRLNKIPKKLLTRKNGHQGLSRPFSNGQSGLLASRILPATDHRTWKADGTVKLKIQETGLQSAAPLTVPEMLNQTVEKLPNHPAIGFQDANRQIVTWTYTDYLEEVRRAAKGFLALGLQPFHSVGILGYNAPEWAVANLAAVHAQGFATGIYQTNSPAACSYVAGHSRANLLVVEDDIQLQKILSIKSELPQLKYIVQYRGRPQKSDCVISWNELMEIGKSQSDEVLDERIRNIAVNQCALLVYTSGTTGNPKGSMLSHDAVTFAGMKCPAQYGWRFGEERLVSYLPLSHVAGQMMDIYWSVGRGCTTYFADANALKGTLVENLKLYRPTRFLAVPRVWEKIAEKIKEAGKANTGIKKAVGDWAKGQALSHHLAKDNGNDHKSLQYKLAQKLVLKKVHEALGLDSIYDMEVATGGAATSADLNKYFLSLDIRLLEVYGSTESCGCPQSSATPGPGNCRMGTIGRPIQDLMDSKLANINPEDGTGELISKGRCILMGYLEDEEKTLKTIDDDGWLYSGDICTQDKDGFLSIVGRSKEIIITAGGENIAPVNIEEAIKQALPDIVSNVMVVGEKQPYLCCLLTLKVQLDPETLQPTQFLEPSLIKYLEEKGIDMTSIETVEQLLGSPAIEKIGQILDTGLAEANEKAISNAARVQKWRILPQEFSVQGGELSPSLKLKRFYVMDEYKDAIDNMYASDS